MKKYYNDLADVYDQLVQEDISLNRFPYAAYGDIQDTIAGYIYDNKHIKIANILDIGIGTASLYEKIIPEKFKLTGIDISERMLDISRLRVPDASLILHDILKGIPEEIVHQKFDYIIINYLFKHFDLETVKSIINQIVPHLSPFGKIFIGDIMFLNQDKKKLYLMTHTEDITTTSTFNYHVYSDIVTNSNEHLSFSFMELNGYTGILIIEKYYESTLHFEETLIKYKTNTVKWNSNQKQKNRE